MNDSTEVTEVFRPVEKIVADGLTEYQREQRRKFAVYERLKAERLAREAQSKSA